MNRNERDHINKFIKKNNKSNSSNMRTRKRDLFNALKNLNTKGMTFDQVEEAKEALKKKFGMHESEYYHVGGVHGEK